MDSGIRIDITFDFRSDTPQGKEPDALSHIGTLVDNYQYVVPVIGA